jgi:hypothetical protein
LMQIERLRIIRTRGGLLEFECNFFDSNCHEDPSIAYLEFKGYEPCVISGSSHYCLPAQEIAKMRAPIVAELKRLGATEAQVRTLLQISYWQGLTAGPLASLYNSVISKVLKE